VILVVASGVMASSGKNVEPFMGIWMSILLVVVFGALGIYLLLPVIAAIACALGKDFRYPVMGMRLEKYLRYDPAQIGVEQDWLNEDHEDRWVAAMSHFSVIIALWGMLAPLIAWMMQGKRSLFLRFQSVQTLVYQVGVTLLFLGGGFITVIVLVLLPISLWAMDNPSLNGSVGVVGAAFLLLIMLITTAIILIVPLFHIMGQWAGYRVLKGEDYRYPVIGKLIDRWISNKTPPGTAA